MVQGLLIGGEDVLAIRQIMMTAGLSVSREEPALHLFWSEQEMMDALLVRRRWSKDRAPKAIYLPDLRECLIGCHNFTSRTRLMYVVAHEMAHHHLWEERRDRSSWQGWIDDNREDVVGLYSDLLMERSLPKGGVNWEVAADLIASHVAARLMGNQPDRVVELSGGFVDDLLR